MSHTAELEQQAARLLSMALNAREEGDITLADLLTRRAGELLEQARWLENELELRKEE
jgi:hypothetical protein